MNITIKATILDNVTEEEALADLVFHLGESLVWKPREARKTGVKLKRGTIALRGLTADITFEKDGAADVNVAEDSPNFPASVPLDSADYDPNDLKRNRLQRFFPSES